MLFSFISWLVIGFLWQTWQGQTSTNQCGKGGSSSTQHHRYHGAFWCGSCWAWQKVWGRNLQHERNRGNKAYLNYFTAFLLLTCGGRRCCLSDFRSVNKMWLISLKILSLGVKFTQDLKIEGNQIAIVFHRAQNVKILYAKKTEWKPC